VREFHDGSEGWAADEKTDKRVYEERACKKAEPQERVREVVETSAEVRGETGLDRV